MMKRLLVAAIAALVCSTLSAQQRVDETTLRNYASKVLPRCPGGVLTLERIGDQGPSGFLTYAATLRSSDEYCGVQKYLLFSPRSQQVLLGTVLVLPADNRPVHVRIGDHTSQLLKKRVTATVAPFPLPDGLKAVTIQRDTDYGPFAYHGFLDASERFLIVGSRGSLQNDPAKELRDALNVATNAARRGNKDAKVEIIELSDFQCPTCARAHKMIEPLIKANLGKVNFLRLDLPLFEHHEWAIPAAMAARAIQRVQPAKYWEFVDYVFENQEAIGKRPFDTVLREYAEDHDLDWKKLEPIYKSKAERTALLEQVSRAFDLGIASTPTFIINGQIMGFGPEGNFTMDAIRQAVGAKPAPPAAKKPAAKKKKK